MIPRPVWLARFERGLGRAIPWHPNAISGLKLLVVAPALFLALRQVALIPGGPAVVTLLFLVFGALDYLDGVVARERELETPFGRVFDRVTDYPLILGLSYFCLDVIPAGLLVAKVGVDLLLLALFIAGLGGTQNRLRTALSYAALLGLLVLSQGWLPQALDAKAVTLLVGANVAFSSIVALYNLRLLRRRAIADLLSLGNLGCGGLSIVASSQGRFDLALALVLLGAAFDGVDGAAARRWGASRWGIYADDVADGVTFGLAPAAAIAFGIGGAAGLVVGLVHLGCVVARLVYFTLRKGETDPAWFEGQPSPAAGILTLGAVVLFAGEPALIALVVGLGGAQMVAFGTRYRHAGRWLAEHERWLLGTPLVVLALAALGAIGGVKAPVAVVVVGLLAYGLQPVAQRIAAAALASREVG